jgi:hypothetical protein
MNETKRIEKDIISGKPEGKKVEKPKEKQSWHYDQKGRKVPLIKREK